MQLLLLLLLWLVWTLFATNELPSRQTWYVALVAVKLKGDLFLVNDAG